MSETSNEGRTNSTVIIQTECWKNTETQRVDTCIKDTWILDQYVDAMRNNGNLNAETLAEFFYFAAETMAEIENEFEDVDITKIDWEQLARAYKEA